MITALQKSPEFRRQGFGSSDASKVMGLSRYGSRFGLYCEKTGESEPEDLDFWAIHRGNALEASLLDWYGREFGVEVLQNVSTMTHPDYPFLFAHVDGLVIAEIERIVEAKAAFGSVRHWGRPGTGEIDPEHIWQACHQMLVLGIPQVDFPVDFGWSEPQVFTVFHDQELEDLYLQEALDLWWQIENQIPPDPDDSLACKKHLESQFLDSRGEVRLATPEEVKLARMLQELQEAAGEVEQEIQAVKNAIRSRMGTAERIHFDFFTIDWKPNVNGVWRFVAKFLED